MTRVRLRLVVALAAVVALATGCADSGAQVFAGSAPRAPRSAVPRTPSAVAPTKTPRPPAIQLGAGLLAFPDAAEAWVAAHPDDPRAPAIEKRLATRPTALWLTGDESFGNLAQDAAMAKSSNRTMLLTLYNIPLRYDGLSAPSSVTLAEYERWVSKVATGLKHNRAIIVLEPDALWFYDRLPSNADRTTRITALRYAVSTIRAADTHARIYLDAGTSSGSVTPSRMAALLVKAGLKQAAGYAVNVSSYAPTRQIQAYAQAIRGSLQSRGIADPRYVTDTGRNGASSWNDDWCNPSAQRLGVVPGAVRGRDGRDFNLWIKAPGTSDGNCGAAGAGAGSYGGQFLPKIAYRMISG